MWRILHGMRSCGLKNDALMDTFYEIIAEKYQTKNDYAILVFHDRYDIPAKAADKERLGESEEVFEYLICAICPLIWEYELLILVFYILCSKTEVVISITSESLTKTM